MQETTLIEQEQPVRGILTTSVPAPGSDDDAVLLRHQS